MFLYLEYTVVSEISCAKIPDDSPLEKVCLFGCGVRWEYTACITCITIISHHILTIWFPSHPFIIYLPSTGLGAAWNTCNVEEGSTVAVFGLGAVGLAIVQGAKARKASRIFAVDMNPAKFDIARSLGATDFVNPKDLPEGTTVQSFIVSQTT